MIVGFIQYTIFPFSSFLEPPQSPSMTGTNNPLLKAIEDQDHRVGEIEGLFFNFDG